VIGCPFMAGPVYMPCVLVQWQGGATSLKVNGIGALTVTSVGTCLNAAGAPQGVAIVSNPATELSAT
jgi:hypothetical protein